MEALAFWNQIWLEKYLGVQYEVLSFPTSIIYPWIFTFSELTIKEEVSPRKGNEPQNSWYPFGTAGGGAPNRDRDGNIITHIYAKETLEVRWQLRKKVSN